MSASPLLGKAYGPTLKQERFLEAETSAAHTERRALGVSDLRLVGSKCVAKSSSLYLSPNMVKTRTIWKFADAGLCIFRTYTNFHIH